MQKILLKPLGQDWRPFTLAGYEITNFKIAVDIIKASRFKCIEIKQGDMEWNNFKRDVKDGNLE